MSTEHTPGPWLAQDTPQGQKFVYASDDGRLVVTRFSQHRTLAENEANARLIAAAPDLLAACQAYLARPDDDSIGAMRAAVAKATGQELQP